jgi:hypothetical protein
MKKSFNSKNKPITKGNKFNQNNNKKANINSFNKNKKGNKIRN